MSQTLLTPRALVTTLLDAISANLGTTDSNPLLNPTGAARSLLLTLHVLFPVELLPALEILDRQLVTRLELQHTTDAATNRLADNAAGHISEQPASQPCDQAASRCEQDSRAPVYVIRSAQQSHQQQQQDPSSRTTATATAATAATTATRSRFRDATAQPHYEVRTRAWNCTCPAFTFSAFPANIGNDARNECQAQGEAKKGAWRFGGESLGNSLPLCKHLLACVLVEHVDTFRHMVLVQHVSMQEVAGWAAE